MTAEQPYYFALSQAPGIGHARFKLLVKHFNTAEKVWKAPDKLLREILGEKTFETFNRYRSGVIPERQLNAILEKDIGVLFLTDSTYPERLKEIFDAPHVLFLKGKLTKEDNLALGVVGTRRMTSYGREVTETLVAELVNVGFTIVSGLARGIDSLAHQTALKNGGRTIAVLGSGLNVIYPPENKKLSEEVIKNGALLSELSPETSPSRGYFPARNRIISGLSLGVLVTEAGEDSGSLITANSALEQNREVFAVPGPIYSKFSKGPSELIKQGAKLVTSTQDIVDELDINKTVKSNSKEEVKGETEEEQKLIDLLKEEIKNIDQLIRESSYSAEKVSSLLLTMELNGKIKNLGNGSYSLKN